MDSTRIKRVYEQAARSFQNRDYVHALLLLTCAEALPAWDEVGLHDRSNFFYARARCLYKLGWFDKALEYCSLLEKTYQDPRGVALAQRILGTSHDGERAA
jgi:hypothetical protein